MQKTPDMKLIDSKWVSKILLDPEGNVYRYKARLCACGFMQQQGINYNGTFTPVVRYDSLRIFLANVTVNDFEMQQFDVQTAFLYGNLEEEVFMELPEGANVVIEASESARKNVVCKLLKSLYGLKQAPRCWNKKFCAFLGRFTFEETDADKCIFVGNFNDTKVYLALFVDDGLIAEESKDGLGYVIECLRTEFEIIIGESSMFARGQIERDMYQESIFLHQSAYTKKIVNKFGMSDAEPISVPVDPHVVMLLANEDDLSNNILLILAFNIKIGGKTQNSSVIRMLIL